MHSNVKIVEAAAIKAPSDPLAPEDEEWPSEEENEEEEEEYWSSTQRFNFVQ